MKPKQTTHLRRVPDLSRGDSLVLLQRIEASSPIQHGEYFLRNFAAKLRGNPLFLLKDIFRQAPLRRFAHEFLDLLIVEFPGELQPERFVIGTGLSSNLTKLASGDGSGLSGQGEFR